MFGLMPTSRTWLDSSFHNIANRADWLCMFCVCARVNRSYCCLSVCKIHCWTVNELIMSEYIHGMFKSCIVHLYPFICRALLWLRKDAVFYWEIVGDKHRTYRVVKMKSCLNYSTDECGAALWNGAPCRLHGPGSLWPVWLQSEDELHGAPGHQK